MPGYCQRRYKRFRSPDNARVDEQRPTAKSGLLAKDSSIADVLTFAALQPWRAMAIIYQTFNFAEAKYFVYITKNPHEADIWVYPVNYLGGHRGDTIWYFTDLWEEATCKIQLCSYGESNIVVYLAPRYTDAGWRNTGKKGRFRFN